MEDQSWLRPESDNRHINVAELDAAIKGLTLAAEWGIKELTLNTDSRTVYGWLNNLLGNERRIKVGGLYEAIVRRRLQIILDIVDGAAMSVCVQWVPSKDNLADELTRVPEKIAKAWRAHAGGQNDVCASATEAVPEPVLELPEIAEAQQQDSAIVKVSQQVAAGERVEFPAFRKVQDQL